MHQLLLNDDLEGQDVILVDHNEFQQSAETIAKANIVNVVDHHRIANFETAGPFILSCRTCRLYCYNSL